MDCAEGSYAQILDHFDNQEVVNKVLLRTQFVFITHLHGDHQHGILKILQERDSLFDESMMNQDYINDNKIYVVLPSPMMKWMQLFVSDSLKHP